MVEPIRRLRKMGEPRFGCDGEPAFRMLRRLAVTAAAVALLGLAARAQVPDPVTAAAAPIPGSAHSYIGTGAETVNPADGTVSFNLGFNLPAQRGAPFTFSIHFGSGEVAYLTPTAQTMDWAGNRVQNAAGGPSLLDIGGWSYGWPVLDFQEYGYQYFTDPNNFYTQCDIASNFVFHGRGSLQTPLTGIYNL